MLVVNLHTLQTIHILNLIHDIFLYGSRPLDGQNIGRSDYTVGKRGSGTHGIVLLHQNLLGQRHKILALLAGLGCNDYLTVTTLYLTHRHLTVNLGNDSRVGRIASLEEFGNTWKTSGDVTGLTHGTRNLDKRLTGLDSLTVFYDNVTSHREVVCTYLLT